MFQRNRERNQMRDRTPADNHRGHDDSGRPAEPSALEPLSGLLAMHYDRTPTVRITTRPDFLRRYAHGMSNDPLHRWPMLFQGLACGCLMIAVADRKTRQRVTALFERGGYIGSVPVLCHPAPLRQRRCAHPEQRGVRHV